VGLIAPVIVTLTCSTAFAQWRNVPPTAIPRGWKDAIQKAGRALVALQRADG